MFWLQYRQEAVWRVKELGRPLPEVARELDISADLLESWCKELGANRMPQDRLSHALLEETRRLRGVLDTVQQVDALVLEGQPAVSLPLMSVEPMPGEDDEPTESATAATTAGENPKSAPWTSSMWLRVPLLLLMMAAVFWGQSEVQGRQWGKFLMCVFFGMFVALTFILAPRRTEA